MEVASAGRQEEDVMKLLQLDEWKARIKLRLRSLICTERPCSGME